MASVSGAVGGLAALALGAGVALGATGTVDLVPDQPAPPLAADVVDYHVCPDRGGIGTFVRGDTVLVVARDESGDWLQVRSPDDLFERVWVEAALLVPDGDVVDAPVVECGEREVVVVEPTDQPAVDTTATPSPSPSPTPSPTPTPTPTPSEPTASPEPSPTQTQAPEPSPTPTQTQEPPPGPTPTPPPTPTQPPNQPPEVSDPEREHALIYDTSGLASACPSSGRPTTSDVSVVVTDDRGVQSVDVTLTLGQSSTDLDVQRSGSTWASTVGPFGNVAEEVVFDVDIVATDTDGATTQRSTTITVRPCP